MNLLDIVAKVGGSIIRNVVPGGGLIVDVVNGFLPDDKKLPSEATGSDINNALSGLPPDKRAQLLDKEFDVEITEIKESNATLRAALKADAENPHSTRPYIAKHSFHVLAFVTVITICLWAYGVWEQDAVLVKTVTDGWPFVLAVVGPFVTLLMAYFGKLVKEQKQKLDAASGVSVQSGIGGLVSAFLKR